MNLHTVRILLVENDSHQAELICQAFASQQRWGAIKIVNTLKETHAFLKGTRPDLVIANFRLPDGEALELLPAIKEESPYPIVILTSNRDEQLAVESLNSYALDYVVKTEEALSSMPHHAEWTLREWEIRKQHKQAEKLQDFQKEFLQKIVAGEPTIDILNALCLQIQEMVPGAICSIMMLEESTGSLHVLAAPMAPENLCAVLDGLIPGENAASCGTAAHTGEPVFVADTEVDPRWIGFRDVARQFGIRGCWSVPIVSKKKKILGTFAISHLAPRSPTSLDRKLLETASFIAGITIQKREAEDELRASEERFRDLYDTAPLAYFTSQINGRIKSANSRAAQLLMYSKEELVGRSVLDFCAQTVNGLEKAQRLLAQKQRGKEIEGEELELQRADGNRLWVSLTVHLIRDAQGDPIETRAMVQDITQRKQEETIRQTSEQAIRELYEITSSPDTSFEQRIRSLLELGCRRFELPIGLLSCLQGDRLSVVATCGSAHEFPVGTSVDSSYTLCQRAFDAGEPIAYEDVDEHLWQAHPFAATKNVRTYLGTPVRVGERLFGTCCFLSTEAHTTPFNKADKDFLQLMVQWLEYELERRDDEESLRELNLALSKAMPAISRVDMKGRYVQMNASYAEMLGYEPSDLTGQSWEPAVHPEDLPIAYAAYETMLEQGQSEFESREVRTDGTVFYKQVMLVKEVDQNGTHIGHHCFMRDITERKHSEEALRESEGRLQAILDNSSAVIYVKDLQGRYLLINRTHETIFNLDRETVKGKTDFDIFPYDIAKAFTENDQKVIKSGGPCEWEELAPHEDGLHTYISNKFLLRNAIGVPYALCGISTDIHQRKQAENRTRLHSRILESSPNGILITDAQQPDGPIIYCNAAFEKITGYSLNEILGLNCRFLQSDDRDQEGLQQIRDAIHTQRGCQVVLRNYKKDGTLFWNDLRLAPVFNEQGELINYIGVQVDITERKSIEDALRVIAESTPTLTGTDFWRFLVKSLAKCLNVKYTFIAECTDSSKQRVRTMVFWNGTTFAENFEYNIARTPCETVMKGEVCVYSHHVQENFPDDEDLKTLEVESYVGYPLFSQSGEIFGHLVAMDIQSLSEQSQAIPIIKLFATRLEAELERHKAEDALRRSEGRLRQVIDLVPHFIFAKDQEGRFILGNDAVAKVYGTTVPSLLGKTDADFAKSKEEVEQFRRDDLEVIESGQVKVIKEEQITDAQGELHYLQTTKIPFVFADTVLPSILGVSIDITEQKTVESQLREAYERTRELTARLKAAEESERKRIARELHDEFGQMLTGLKFDIAWVGRRLSEESKGSISKELYEKTQSMSKLTDEIIHSVRQIAASLRPTILDDLGLVPALDWQAREFQSRTGIQCQVTTGPKVAARSLNADQTTALFRITQELFTNVMRHAEASQVKVGLREETDVVVLTFEDNGRGISEREVGDPASLGLLGIKERVTLLGGSIVIQGKSGQGTHVLVRIPLYLKSPNP